LRFDGESEPITLPFDQGIAAWVKIYGTGYHNPDAPGFALAWWFRRIALVADFTGSPKIGTKVTMVAKEGQKPFTESEAAEIARALGLKNRQADPNYEGSPLWTGEKFGVRFLRSNKPAPSPNISTMIEIWTNLDPNGPLPPPDE
jgi:hypothetical protein